MTRQGALTASAGGVRVGAVPLSWNDPVGATRHLAEQSRSSLPLLCCLTPGSTAGRSRRHWHFMVHGPLHPEVRRRPYGISRAMMYSSCAVPSATFRPEPTTSPTDLPSLRSTAVSPGSSTKPPQPEQASTAYPFRQSARKDSARHRGQRKARSVRGADSSESRSARKSDGRAKEAATLSPGAKWSSHAGQYQRPPSLLLGGWVGAAHLGHG